MLPSLDEIPKKRKALGLTQSKLAQLAGVSQSIIAKIESGTVDPSYSIAKRLVEALEKQSIQASRPRVSEIMSKPVISVSKTQLVREAVDLMRRRFWTARPAENRSNRYSTTESGTSWTRLYQWSTTIRH